jgi:hypothetical protein
MLSELWPAALERLKHVVEQDQKQQPPSRGEQATSRDSS